MQALHKRETVDVSGYPDLVLIMLGFKARRLRNLSALIGIGRGLTAIRRDPPDGLLHHEVMLMGWNHVGIRQYWRDFESLERFTRAMPHVRWWQSFGKDPDGAGFWHETFSASGGVEAIYLNMPDRPGLSAFAPICDPVGRLLSSRDRLAGDARSRAAG